MNHMLCLVCVSSHSHYTKKSFWVWTTKLSNWTFTLMSSAFCANNLQSIVEWYYKLLESLIFSSRSMATAVKILDGFLFLSRNNEHIMLYEKVKNDCVPIWLKETECSSHIIPWCKNEKLKTSPLKTDEGQNNIFHYFYSVYSDYPVCLD